MNLTSKYQKTWTHLIKIALLGGYTLLAPLIGGLLVVMFSPDFTPSTPDPAFIAGVLFAGAILVGIALVPSIVFAGYVGYVVDSSFWAMILAALAIGFSTLLGIQIFRSLSGTVTESILAFKSDWLLEYERLQNQHPKGMIAMIVIARLSPQMPFAATNLMIAQLKISLIKATLASWIGLLPRSLFAVLIGRKATEIEQIADIGSFGWDSLATFLLFGFVIIWSLKKWIIPRLKKSYSS